MGLCSVTFRDESTEKIIDLTKNAGLEAIEWGSDSHIPETDPEKAKKVAQLMKEARLKSTSYGTYYRLGSFDNFESYLTVAKILDVSTLRVWAGEKESDEADKEYRKNIVEDAQRIGELAAKEGLSVSLEYHAKTLTDTPESSVQLMREIDSPNVFLYWQPAESLTVEERTQSIPELAK